MSTMSRLIRTTCFLVPALALSLAALGEATQKPTSWVELDMRLTLLHLGAAELELQLNTPLPSESVSVQLDLPEAVQTSPSNPWTGDLPSHEPMALNWLVQGDLDYNTPIGVEVKLVLPDGRILTYQEEVDWPTPGRSSALRVKTAPDAGQNRQGEALWVVPLNAGQHQ